MWPLGWLVTPLLSTLLSSPPSPPPSLVVLLSPPPFFLVGQINEQLVGFIWRKVCVCVGGVSGGGGGVREQEQVSSLSLPPVVILDSNSL